MLLLGLTGSIAMGKSTVAQYLRSKCITVCDADAIVHDLYRGRAVTPIEAAFPGTTTPEGVDRTVLSAVLAGDPGALARLEAIVHPLVRAEEIACLDAAYEAGATIAVLEIPLLFETNTHNKVDAVAVVSAPPEVQRRRILERPDMTAAKLDLILARQTPDAEKRALADFVIDTAGTFEETYEQVDCMLEALADRHGDAYEKHWS